MKKDLQQGVLVAIGTAVTSLLTFIYTSKIVSTSIDPRDYSDFASVLSLVIFFNIALGPISSAVTRFTAVYATESKPGKIRTLYQRMGIRVFRWGGIGVVLVLLLSYPIASQLRLQSSVLVLMLMGIVFLNLSVGLSRGVMRGTQSIGGYTANVVSESALRLLLGFGLLLVMPSAWSALLAYVLALAAVTLFGHYQASHEWKGQECEPIDGTDIRQFSIPLFLMMFLLAGFENLDMLFVKRFFSEDDAAAFGPAFILARAITVVATPFTVLALPRLTVLFAQGKPMLKVFGLYVLGFVLLVSIPLVLLYRFDHMIISCLYTSEYANSIPLVFPVALSRVPTYLSGLVALLFASQKKFKFLKLYLIFFVLQVGVLLFKADTPLQVPWIMFGIQSGGFICLLGYIGYSRPENS